MFPAPMIPIFMIPPVYLDTTRRADLVEAAGLALWRPGEADSAAVEDEHVRHHRPLFLWKQRHQFLLDLHGICVSGEAEPRAETPDMGVADGALVFPEHLPEYGVGWFSVESLTLCSGEQ